MSAVTTTALSHARRIDIPTVRPLLMLGSLMVADSLALGLATAVSVLTKGTVTGDLEIAVYARLIVFLPAFLAAYGAAGLYSGLAFNPPEEIRRSTACSAVMFLLLSTLTVSMRGAKTFVKPTLFFAIALSALLVPLLRAAVRRFLGQRDWWGYPAVIFGAPATAARLTEQMLRNPGQGLKPVAIVHDVVVADDHIAGVPVLSSLDLIASGEMQTGTYAVLTEDARRAVTETIESHGWRFSHIIVIPKTDHGLANLQVSPRPVGNFLGLEMCQQVLMPRKRLAKRILDFSLALLAAPVLLPLTALMAIWIKCDSPGPVFFGQKRIGRGRKSFRAWKFRSMVINGDEVLKNRLETDPWLREEWKRNHKLKRDPRVTRAGRFLRKTSLDELPQLWNVLRGEMSLVGPRPIVEAEVVKYGSRFETYTKVPGGITGLWQVSGRNDTTYEERVSLDEFYVRNWSVWMDFYILFRTISAVLLRKGAY